MTSTYVSLADALSSSKTSSTSSSSSTSGSASNTMTTSDFLVLLTEELKNQDPTSPMSTSDMVNQMSQMQSVMEMEKMQTALENLTASNEKNSAMNMMGKMVTYGDATSGSFISAKVDSLSISGSTVLLELSNNALIYPSNVVAISSGSSVTSGSSTTSGSAV